MHAHSETVRGRNFKLFKTSVTRAMYLDISPLCQKFTYRFQVVVEGQVQFAQCLLSQGILSVTSVIGVLGPKISLVTTWLISPNTTEFEKCDSCGEMILTRT